MSFVSWIKIEVTTPDKPEVIAMAARLRVKDPDTITGKLVRLWAWADLNSVDGAAVSITRAHIDRLTACKGFASALEAVGWLEGPDGAISFPLFDRHNGKSAKARAVETRKKQLQRFRERDEPPKRNGTSVPVTSGQTRGPELELEVGGERARADALVDSVNRLRDEWAAAPVLTDAERRVVDANRSALEALAPETWEAMRRYLSAKLPEGSGGWQPRQRLKFLETAVDVAAQAVSWQRKHAGTQREEIPIGFVRWAGERYSSLPPRTAWLSPALRDEWKQDTQQTPA